ncbi:prolyl 3-hydroxylase 2 isoform X2 [Brienomyrus brachyistius]|uniref:prolyl 3-hydroxylase 2 isoform X2 n=1 Tax=Brienomyrus brachyistius TaxID=42636 RepID=UPI0020B1A31E|nr:prolyl 3-hydroxylase 2 isoform X2 [Brienomyrus brachyistius]
MFTNCFCQVQLSDKMDISSSPSALFVLTSTLFQLFLLSPVLPLLEPFDRLYQDGTDAFYRNDFKNAVHYIEKALHSYRELRRTKIHCRLLCLDQHPLEAALSDFQFFGSAMRRASCLNKCMQERVGPQSVHKVSEEVTQEFRRRTPHKFLQIACNKLREENKAAAAESCVHSNLEHVEEVQNPKQDQHFETGSEAQYHQHVFLVGVEHYRKGDHEEAVRHFERALVEYYKADMECRVLCEDQQNFGEQTSSAFWNNVYQLISDYFVQVLHCKHECVRELATRPGHRVPMQSYLPLLYDHLQFSYFKVGKIQDAMASAQACLLFHKGEGHMVENVAFYRKTLGHDFKPRKEAEWYFRRHEMERTLFLVESETRGAEIRPENYWHQPLRSKDIDRVPLGPSRTTDYPSVSVEMDTSLDQDYRLTEGGPLLYDHIQLVQNSKGLNGPQRVLLDNVISGEECRELRDMATVVCTAGDGYNGEPSPHTPNEKFEGSTILKALRFADEGRIRWRNVRLFYDVSEKVRRIVESYFMLNSTLHFSYTHLVCRTALSDHQHRREDMSHAVHVDNCILDSKANMCLKVPPAYTFRDYSALLYLNGDFEGGEFIFTEMDGESITATVKPNCGRMLGFSSGAENPHGVHAVTKGQRCAVGMWFTLDPLHREQGMLKAGERIQLLVNEDQSASEVNLNSRVEL